MDIEKLNVAGNYDSLNRKITDKKTINQENINNNTLQYGQDKLAFLGRSQVLVSDCKNNIQDIHILKGGIVRKDTVINNKDLDLTILRDYKNGKCISFSAHLEEMPEEMKTLVQKRTGLENKPVSLTFSAEGNEMRLIIEKTDGSYLTLGKNKLTTSLIAIMLTNIEKQYEEENSKENIKTKLAKKMSTEQYVNVDSSNKYLDGNTPIFRYIYTENDIKSLE